MLYRFPNSGLCGILLISILMLVIGGKVMGEKGKAVIQIIAMIVFWVVMIFFIIDLFSN